jgi:hypothetical protein
MSLFKLLLFSLSLSLSSWKEIKEGKKKKKREFYCYFSNSYRVFFKRPQDTNQNQTQILFLTAKICFLAGNPSKRANLNQIQILPGGTCEQTTGLDPRVGFAIRDNLGGAAGFQIFEEIDHRTSFQTPLPGSNFEPGSGRNSMTTPNQKLVQG